MKTETKRWTHLGLTAALAGTTLLAACGNSGEAGEVGESGEGAVSTTDAGEGETTARAPSYAPASGGEGEGVGGEGEGAVGEGEGGEGEGGVAVDQAATDPVVFRSALAITEAHIVAARDAFAVGETSAAAEMFAHPVSEVLFDVGPYLQQQGVENFDQMLLDASNAVFDGETAEQITERTAEIINVLRAAAEKAPDNGFSEARVQAGVASDQIDRAAVMYVIAGDSDDYEPYLDGYGFVIAAQAAYDQQAEAIQAELPEAAAAIEAALAALSDAYPAVERPDTLDVNPARLTAASSSVLLALGE